MPCSNILTVELLPPFATTRTVTAILLSYRLIRRFELPSLVLSAPESRLKL